MHKKDIIKSLIIVIDQNFGFNQVYNNQLVGISIFKSISDTLIYFNRELGLKIVLLVRENLDQQSIDSIKRSMPFVDDIIKFTESENNFFEISSLDPKETMFITSDRFLRHDASKKGYLTTSHISIAKLILNSESIHFVK